MTRAEINRLSRKFRIQKQNKGENTPGFVFANSIAEACDQRVIELETGSDAHSAIPDRVVRVAPPKSAGKSVGTP
jgi:hypothetical protein